MPHLLVSSSPALQKAIPPSCQTIRWQEESRHLHFTTDNLLIALKALPPELLKHEDKANSLAEMVWCEFFSFVSVKFNDKSHTGKRKKLVKLMNLLRIPVQRILLLFCLFSKGMSEGALSPLLIHLLPLVYVTDGDPGPHYPRSTSTPSDSPTNLCRKEDCLLVCSPFIFFIFSLVKCLCVLVWRAEWARAKSKFTHLTLTMLMFGSKARTWPLCTNSHPSKLGERTGRVGDQPESDNGVNRRSFCFRCWLKSKN